MINLQNLRFLWLKTLAGTGRNNYFFLQTLIPIVNSNYSLGKSASNIEQLEFKKLKNILIKYLGICHQKLFNFSFFLMLKIMFGDALFIFWRNRSLWTILYGIMSPGSSLPLPINHHHSGIKPVIYDLSINLFAILATYQHQYCPWLDLIL
jgi:hypothetical protein